MKQLVKPLLERLRYCSAQARLAGAPFDKYTYTHITADEAGRLLAFLDAFDRMAGWQDIATEITKEVWEARYALEGEG